MFPSRAREPGKASGGEVGTGSRQRGQKEQQLPGKPAKVGVLRWPL